MWSYFDQTFTIRTRRRAGRGGGRVLDQVISNVSHPKSNNMLSNSIYLLVIISQVGGITLPTSTQTLRSYGRGQCRDRYGFLDEDVFSRRACATCYNFLFGSMVDIPLMALPPKFIHLALIKRNDSYPPEILEIMDPDIHNETLMTRICDIMNDADKCERWKDCCWSGTACCKRQLSNTTKIQRKGRYCHRVWDGWSCWDDTGAGHTAYQPCASYIDHTIPTRQAEKICQKNGTWFQKGGNSWTDYRPCLDKKGYLEVMYAGVSCRAISVALLLPAMIIFMTFKELRRQQRVKLHVNFFFSLTLAGIANILWYMLVHYNLLTTPMTTEAVLNQNPVWCRCLSILKIYLESTTYFWMFCEGYFLHRLITKAFEPPKTLFLLYIAGWATPLIPSIAYAIVFAIKDNTSCWTRSKFIGGFQWFIYTPNLLCLLANTLFLCNILRILLFQLHSHPHEPSNFRRGLKAAFMLVPLFGLQLFLTMYRPSGYAKAYNIMSTIVNSSQGIFVAVIFCYFNGEVLNHFKNTCPCLRQMMLRQRSRMPSTSVTQYTTYDDDRDTGVRSRALPPANDLETNTYVANGKENMEMEEFTRSNGSVGKAKKGGYMPVPTSVANEAALM